MNNFILVMIGSAIGGGFRYWLSSAVYKFLPETFPFGTLTVNVVGSFILGLFIFFFDERELLNNQLRFFLTMGFCGGFTTFSTFSLETFYLLKDSEYFLASLNVITNVFVCLAGVFLAYAISKII